MTKDARTYRSAHRKGKMNKTEAMYALHLESQKKEGEIADWEFEVETLKLGDDCRYTPDFRVIKNRCPEDPTKPTYCEIEFHEVKGTLRRKRYSGDLFDIVVKPFVEDDALVKIKCAAEIHCIYKFILVWKGLYGEWIQREIN